MKKDKWPGKPTHLHLLLPNLEKVLQTAIVAAVEKLGIKPEAVEVKRSGTAREITSLEEGSRTAIQYFTTRTLDRDNEILVPKGAIMDQFEASNMQVFWNHDYHQLIGSDEKIKRDDFGWKAWTRYAEHADPGARANIVWELKQQGHLKTNSVGFGILESTQPGHSDWNQTIDTLGKAWPEFTSKTAKNTARIITKYMVIEHSDVGVPSNVDSTLIAAAKGYGAKDEDIEKMFNIEVKDFPTGDPKVRQRMRPTHMHAKEFGKLSATQLREALEDLVHVGGSDTWTWIADIYDNTFVYEVDGQSMFRQGYALEADQETVVLTGDRQEVERDVQYTPKGQQQPAPKPAVAVKGAKLYVPPVRAVKSVMSTAQVAQIAKQEAQNLLKLAQGSI